MLPKYSTVLQSFAIAKSFGISPVEVLNWDYEMYLLAVEYMHAEAYAAEQRMKGGTA